MKAAGVSAAAVETSSLPAQAPGEARVADAEKTVKGFYRKGMTMAEMQKTATDFESVFLSEMLKPMFEGIKADETFGGGEAENQWRSLMIDEYGKSMAARGGVGIAQQVMKMMLSMQHASEGAGAADNVATVDKPTSLHTKRYLSHALPPASLSPTSLSPASGDSDETGRGDNVLSGLL